MAGEHIVMLPFMAQGHLIPFLALAKLIADRNPGITITLASTALNIQNLSPLLPQGSTICLHVLPFRASDHGLPPGAENTDSLSFPDILRFYPASASLRPQFELLLADLTRHHGRPPLLIIADVFFGWTVDIARSLNVYHAAFTTCGGYGSAVYFSLYLHPLLWAGSQEFGLPGFPETFRLHRSQMSRYLKSTDGSEPWFLFFKKQISLSLSSDAMLCNTVEEVEPEGLRLLRDVTGIRVCPVGPLLPLESNSSNSRAGKRSGVEPEACIEWLDSHPLASVIYISFGSQNTISAAQMMALAMGLEASGYPFIWVLRPPIGFDVKEDFRDEWLPLGFLERMRKGEKGLVVRRWAPQLEILSHGSTGAFLSHCGWNSVLESLSRGVPVIGWPLASEQFYNSKMLEEELGVGVELARGVEDGVESGEVERVVRLVMGEEKGREMRERVVGIKGMIRAAMREEGADKGSSLRAVDGFVETVLIESRRTKDGPAVAPLGSDEKPV